MNSSVPGPNYQLKFTVADAARILSVSEELIKEWAETFVDHVGQHDRSGTLNFFKPVDLSALAYISTYWEPEPDIDSIRLGLAAEEHLGFPFYEVAMQATPIFIEFPDDMEDRNAETSALLVDQSEFELAGSYLDAGNRLLEASIADDLRYELLFPIIYCYRHATELYIKSVLPVPDSEKRRLRHNLLAASHQLSQLVRAKANEELPEWFKNIVLVFHEFDGKGETFRYGGDLVKNETFIDFHHLQSKMEMLKSLFTDLKLFLAKGSKHTPL